MDVDASLRQASGSSTLRSSSERAKHRKMSPLPRRGAVVLIVGCLAVISPAAASARADPDSVGAIVHGLEPDKFVQSAPLVVAAVCRNGVAILSAHTSETSEPLLYHTLDWSATDDEQVPPITKEENDACPFPDLPADYGGPFRIHVLDGFGSTLVAAGWRGDCESLAYKCRALAASETGRFGKPSRSSLYADILAEETSLYLAQCAISDRYRPLACAALFASPDGANGTGRLWLIDATGAYRVRAHCIGGGSIDGAAQLASDLVNERLMKTNFESLSVEQGLVRLVDIVSGRTCDSNAKPEALKSGTRVEFAVVDSARRQLVRKRGAFVSMTDNANS